MRALLGFGEEIDGYDIPVLNEREARAGAGILFALALIAFMNAFLVGNFAPIRVVAVVFFIDFFIRVLISPKYAPSLILGRLAVRNQTPEFTGAPQKHFAWALGLGLATIMVVLVAGFDVRGPINMLICVTCLTLLFFETAFGICIGCLLYRVLLRRETVLCPGGVCEVSVKHPVQRTSTAQLAALTLAGILLIGAGSVIGSRSYAAPFAAQGADRCKVPAYAIALGHEQMWKQRNNCL
ncbi:MAG: DUF4395 domain-containing protein [Xanthobacteraceae bacterium]|jgi:hypothetical protein